MELEQFQADVWKTQVEKGFEEDTNLDRKLLLAVGELTEAQNELRNGHPPKEVYFDCAKNDCRGGDKPEGFPIELADAVIKILNIVSAVGISPEQFSYILLQKALYNATRPYKHGKAF